VSPRFNFYGDTHYGNLLNVYETIEVGRPFNSHCSQKMMLRFMLSRFCNKLAKIRSTSIKNTCLLLLIFIFVYYSDFNHKNQHNQGEKSVIEGVKFIKIS